MAQLLSWSCTPLLLLPLIGICFTKSERDGVRSEVHIFHHSCALKKDEGPCKAIKDRFYFDFDTGRCELFEYGGCQGNANNFETLQECEEMCLVKAASNHMEQNAPLKPEEEPKPKTEPLAKHVEAPLNASHLPTRRVYKPSAQEAEFCLSPVDRGDCDGSERRYVYNPRTKRCQMFRYTGCGGNKNNFVNKIHCMKKCMKGHRRRQIRIKMRKSNTLFRSV
ncbi:boophilin-H2-like isoform X2 [Carassius carassius]|uniref:boophilin-H2-like isoform X2 n=1 Tax=Carassius carassius TaxID=217509 RepID=UPI002869171C|nr:boophilin-H2-like isoform X2 [Carassius carassius]